MLVLSLSCCHPLDSGASGDEDIFGDYFVAKKASSLIVTPSLSIAGGAFESAGGFYPIQKPEIVATGRQINTGPKLWHSKFLPLLADGSGLVDIIQNGRQIEAVL